MASETTDDAELIERLRGPVFGTPTALDAAAAIETWKARAERLADMHRDMCVVAGQAIARAERAEAAVPDLLCSLERMLLEFDFLVEDGTLPDIRNDIILVQAREAIAKATS